MRRERTSVGWFKVYGPGEFRGRDGWHIRGRDMYGRWIEGRLPPTVTTKDAAERLGSQSLRRSNRHPPPPVEQPAAPAAPDRSFKAAANAYRISRRPSDVEWKRIERLIACPDIGPVHVNELTTEQGSKFASEAMPKNKPDTLNREIMTPYSSVLHFAGDMKWCTKVVIHRFREQEDENSAISPTDVDRLVEAADKSGSYARRPQTEKTTPYKIALLEYLRLPETWLTDVLRLRPEDLEPATGRIRVMAGEWLERPEVRQVSQRVMGIFLSLAPCPDKKGKVWLFPWHQKASIHNWLRPLAAAHGVTATPRMWHHASHDPELDAGLLRMIAEPQRVPDGRATGAAQVDRNGPYKVAFLEFLRLRGTRITDVLNLEREADLDLPGGRVRLTIGKRRDRVQWLPLTPLLVSLLANLAACDGKYVFPWRTRFGVYAWFGPMCEALGIDATPHQFRHALGEQAIDAEIDLLTLKTMMGAASLNSVRRYARSSWKRLEQADRLRAEEARRPRKDGREMVAADFELPTVAGNVVPLKKAVG